MCVCVCLVVYPITGLTDITKPVTVTNDERVLHRRDMYVWRVRNVLFSGSGRTSMGRLGQLFGARKRPKRAQIVTAESKTAVAGFFNFF